MSTDMSMWGGVAPETIPSLTPCGGATIVDAGDLPAPAGRFASRRPGVGPGDGLALHVRAHRGGHGAGSHGAESAHAHPGHEPEAPSTGGDRPSSERGATEILLNQHLLAANDRHAQGIRGLLRDHDIFCANLMSSPGAGKTALLEATFARSDGHPRTAVIEGDIETSADADRLAPFDLQVVQVNTGPFGGDCHLAAPLVASAIEKLDLHAIELLIVENVGNLVCPAEFDIGEDAKVVLLSVTEGEDKPLKYPLMFHEASLALVTKIDLLPHLDADLDLIRANIRTVNPALPVICLSARSGEGMSEWLTWLGDGVAAKAAASSG